MHPARDTVAVVAAAVIWSGLAGLAGANERYFTYTYEPETMPQGALEFEQWVTLRAGRSAAAGRDDFNRWDVREEFEYGVTDNYTAALYLNLTAQNYRNPATNAEVSDFDFDGVSLENRWMIADPADAPLGVALYVEPSYSGEEAELEEKLIVGQRHGDWKWAVNLVHETEWEHHLHDVEGTFKAVGGLTRHVAPRWSVGLETLLSGTAAEYETWENAALFAGPVVAYHEEAWWGALTIMPQLWGKNFEADTDGQRHLDLQSHERLNVRLLLGKNF